MRLGVDVHHFCATGAQNLAITSPFFSGTTLESTAVLKRQPRRVLFKEASVTSLVRSFRDGPSFTREERANFVNELLLSMSRKSDMEAPMKVGNLKLGLAGRSSG